MNTKLICLPMAAVALVITAAVRSNAQNVMPERTEIHVELTEDLKSGVCSTGDEVDFKVSRDVYGPGHELLIVEGTPAYGHVIESRRRGILGKPGKLNFSCDYVLMPDGAHVPVRSTESNEETGHSNDTASIAAALVVTPYAMFINGKDIEVKPGSEFTVMASETTHLCPAVDRSANEFSAPAATAQSNSLFTLRNGDQLVGSLVSFDGHAYTIATASGSREVDAADVKSVYSVSGPVAQN